MSRSRPPATVRPPVGSRNRRVLSSEGDAGIAGTRQTGSGRDNASGYAAGFTIVIPLLLGAALGYVLGLLVDQELLLLPLGALAGLVFGFYAVYVRFIR